MKPVAGRTHHLVLSKGAPGNETLQGLMLTDLKNYTEQPYVPFAPAAGEGQATNRDTNVTATWEKQQDFSGGVGKLIERKTEDNGYAYSFANTAANGKVGATLFTGVAGCLMPPAAWTGAGTDNDVIQFCEFKLKWCYLDHGIVGSSTSEVYVYDSDGDTPTQVNGGPGAGLTGNNAKQIYTDGATLYVTQGASNPVRITTSAPDSAPGSMTWNDYELGSPAAKVNADFVCVRDDGALAYVAGATLTPGAGVAGTQSYSATTIGASGTTATGMVFYKGALWIGKPEGLWSWYQGKVDKRFDAMEHQSTTNFTKMCVHHDLLYFNVKNHLYYTDGDRYVEIFPNDANGFANIQSIFPTSGPLLIGGKLQTQAQGQTPYYFATAQAEDESVGTVSWTSPENAISVAGANPSDNAYATTNIGQVIAGPQSPTLVQNGGLAGRVQWQNPMNAISNDEQYARCVLGAGQISDILQARHFHFSIPADATIIGIAVTVEGNVSSATSATAVGGCIVKGGVQYGGGTFSLPAQAWPETSWMVGGNDNLWETTWTPADINADDFGVDLVVKGAAARTYNLDQVTITVWYLPKSHYLKLTGFNIALPTNAVPTGVVVDIESEWGYSNTFTAKLVKGGVIGGSNGLFLPVVYVGGTPAAGTEKHYWTYSFSSLWGNNLTRDDIAASDFGVAISASGMNGTVRVDAVKIRVFYNTIDADREQLFMFWGPDAPGLNPIWSDADGTKPVLAIGVTGLFDSTGERIYFCCAETVNTHKIKFFSMTPRYVPASFRTDTRWEFTSYIELTEFSAGFRTVPKWWYEVVLNVRDPLATTYAKVDYCIDNGPWEECVDENGVPATLQLSNRAVGCYIPFDKTGLYINLRIHMWATGGSITTATAAKITHVTLRGLTKPKPRMQFSFPVNCGEKVKPLIGEDESGEVIHDFIYSAARQGYPCKLQDPWGDWHLVAFREPGPLRTIKEFKPPERDAPLRVFTIVTCVLMEVDRLTSDGDSQTWEAG